MEIGIGEMELSLSHIAIAVPKLKVIQDRLRVLNLNVSEFHEVKSEGVNAGMVPVSVSPKFRIELLEPSEPNSPLTRFLQKRKDGGLHHLCFEVKKIDHWKAALEKEGIQILPPGIRDGAKKKILFIHPQNIKNILIKLEEIG